MTGNAREPLPSWRRLLARLLLGAVPGELLDAQRQQAEKLRQAVAEIAELRKDQLQAHESTSNWLRGASAHLAALQTEYDRIKAGAAPGSTSSDTIRVPPFDWIKGAENHLAALQTGHDRLQSILHRQTDQVTRVIARLALLDARLTDLERADTAIAAAIGRTASAD
jgi:hypothetical protein